MLHWLQPVDIQKTTRRQQQRAREHRRLQVLLMWLVGFAVLTCAALLTLRPALADLQDPPYAKSFSGSYLAARSAGMNSDLRSAAHYYRQALQRDPGDTLLRQQTFTLLLADGDVEGAIPFAQVLADEAQYTHFVNAALGAEAMRLGQFDKARDALRDTREGPLVELSLGILRAWATAGQFGKDQALAEIDRLRGPNWFDPFKSYHSGLIAAFGKDFEQAERFLREAHRTENGSLWVRVAADYARILATNGKKERGLEVIQEAIQSFGDNVLLDVARQEIEGDALDYLTSLTPAQGAAEILYDLGIAVSRDGGEQLTLIYLRLALYLDPDLHIARLFLANYFERIDNYERMIGVLEAIPSTSPLYPESTIRVGMALNSLDRFEDSRDHLAQSIETLTDNRIAITALGDVYRMRKEYEEASKVYSAGIEQLQGGEPDAWQLYFSRGITYERTDQWPKAEADFKKALEYRPNQARVLNYLGYSWVDKGMNYDEALGMIERAVELRPNDGYIVDSLGWAFYKLGRYEEAVVELERAVELRPTDPTINDHLGDAYWKVGRKLEAIFQWSHARDSDPDPELAAKIEEKLESGLNSGAASQADSGAGATTALE